MLLVWRPLLFLWRPLLSYVTVLYVLLEIAGSTKLLTSDTARAKISISLINQVALVGQQHETFRLQGMVVDVAHVGQAHSCHQGPVSISEKDVFP